MVQGRREIALLAHILDAARTRDSCNNDAFGSREHYTILKLLSFSWLSCWLPQQPDALTKSLPRLKLEPILLEPYNPADWARARSSPARAPVDRSDHTCPEVSRRRFLEKGGSLDRSGQFMSSGGVSVRHRTLRINDAFRILQSLHYDKCAQLCPQACCPGRSGSIGQ